ncbi:MAG: hypothetical protein AAB522_01335 [Patescibacteria group bacterium]
MFLNFRTKIIGLVVLLVLAGVGTFAFASHSWGPYHWARTANPFTLKLGDNVSSAWDAYLAEASADWSLSSVLDTTVVAGQSNIKTCKPTAGRVEVCNRKYGFNGWLGVASIWVSGSHITQGTVKLNDSYFNTSTYNTPPWRRLVMCQEVAHTFGLDHQDEDFTNPNLGSCMDYTRDPDGPPSNEHPNTHDYKQLELIYSHLDSITTIANKVANIGNHNNADEWGKSIRKDNKGKTSLHERDLGNGEKLFTFVLWTE